MRIAQIAPPWITVPPQGYGGIEWVVSLLADGLVDRGHDVTLFASGDSRTKAKLEGPFETEQRSRMGDAFPDALHAISAYLRQDEFDVIHDHSGIIGPAFGALARTPVLHTLHGPFTEDAKRFYRTLSGNIWFNSISDFQAAGCPDLSYVGTIYNSIDIGAHPFRADKEDYLLYLGRFSALKGAGIAVKVAKELGIHLKMAGKIDNEEESSYFEEHVRPYLGHGVEFLGEVTNPEKAALLGRAKALLFPIQWAEPFGLVMPEAMACGTPVVAIRNGSVPEIIEDGITGFIVDDETQMARATVKAIENISPHVCRLNAIERFGSERMVADYEAAFRRITTGSSLRNAPPELAQI